MPLRSSGALEGVDGCLPVFRRAGVVGGLGGVPGAELDLEVREAERPQHGFRKLDAGDDFVFNLRGRAEDVRVILREAAHAQQAVHGAGALVAVHVAELGVALRQVSIALRRIFCRSKYGRGSSSASGGTRRRRAPWAGTCFRRSATRGRKFFQSSRRMMCGV